MGDTLMPGILLVNGIESDNEDLEFDCIGAGKTIKFKRDGVEVASIGDGGFDLPAAVFTEKYESAWEATSNGINQFYSHGLSGTPTSIMGLFRVANDDTLPHIIFGSLGVWGQASGVDYGIAMAASNTHIVCAIGEGGVSTDWGTTTNNNSFPHDSLASHVSLDGTPNDYIDTPTETAGGTLNSGYIKIIAYR